MAAGIEETFVYITDQSKARGLERSCAVRGGDRESTPTKELTAEMLGAVFWRARSDGAGIDSLKRLGPDHARTRA